MLAMPIVLSNNGISFRLRVIHEDKTIAEQSKVIVHYMVIDSLISTMLHKIQICYKRHHKMKVDP